MPGVRSERATMSPAEEAKQARRLARAIQQGTPILRLQRSFGVTEGRILEVAARFNLEVVRGKAGSGRSWA